MRQGLLAIFLLFPVLLAQKPGPEGVWEGTLDAMGNKLRLGVTITKAPDGTLSAKLDSPNQGAFGLPLQDVKLDGDKLTFTLKMVNGSFEGVINEPATEISGKWKQGLELPLVLKRVAAIEKAKRPQEPQPPFPYSIEDVTVPNTAAGLTLACTITIPKRGAPHPAVVLITGSGPQDRDEALMGHRPFFVLADHLTRRGIAVLRCDDRGTAKSTGKFAAATTQDFADDAAAEAEFLSQRKDIDPRRIGLLGHSEGGLIAPIVASRSQNVSFVVLLAGTAVPGEQVLYEQGRAIGKAAGGTDELLNTQTESQRKIFTILREEPSNAAAEKRLREALPAGAEAQIRQVTTPWFRYFLTYDPAPALEKLTVPVLALFGENDLQVIASQNRPGMEAALQKSGNPDVTVVTIPKANHLFQISKTGSPAEYAQIEQTMAPVALDTMSTWIRQRARLEKAPPPPDHYPVTWDSPSRDSSGSMPLGNGDIGINLWVEPGGDLLFYVGKTDTWSENIRLLKLGRIRVKLNPNPFAPGQPFRQVLKPESGLIEIDAADARITAWVDAWLPVVRIEVKGSQPRSLKAELEDWRKEPRPLDNAEVQSAYGLDGGPKPVLSEVDTVLPVANNRAVWYHRNSTSPWAGILRHQGLASFISQEKDPLLGLTFGGALEPVAAEARAEHLVQVHVLTQRTATAKDFLDLLDARIRQNNAFPLEAMRGAHTDWWREFYTRSYIRVSGPPEASTVTQGYALQRFINAAAGRGAFPIKFNGSIFNVDEKTKDGHFDADYRRWGGPYWFQNTRLPYWTMLSTGDWDLMTPLFRMYLDALPLAQARTRSYFKINGAVFPETMYFFGAYANSNYGWNRQGHPPAYVENTYIRHYFSSGLELLALMLDRYAFTYDRDFVRYSLLPLADPILGYYDRRFPRGKDGRLIIKPAGALENHTDVLNPTPEIAGLKFVLPRLLQLPQDWITPAQRSFYEQLLKAVPGLPLKDGVLQPAQEIYSKRQNVENPELYAVFPYRTYGVGKPDLTVGRATFEARQFRKSGGWQQDAIQAAYLGLAAAASQAVVQNFSSQNPGSRFPAFWGPNYDWIPDQDHGTVAMTALQRMLLQWEGDRIYLLPAWPKSWNVDFKLYAPNRTTVEGVFRNGKLEKLTVTPPERRQDIVIGDPQ
jgi:alpha-L-fucosidase 2